MSVGCCGSWFTQHFMKRSPTTIASMETMAITNKTNSFDSASTMTSNDMFTPYLIGSGGFSSVWRIEENFVKKTLTQRNKNAVEEFIREASFIKSLNHPNIVSYESFDQLNLNMVLEFCGECLYDIVSDSNTGLGDTCFRDQCFSQMISAVVYLHKLGIAHMDLKLENLCVREGVLKIIDFGLAVQQPMGSRGSMAYAAPEVLKNKYTNIKAADIWSIGIVLFSMTYGFFPFQKATEADWRYTGIIDAVSPTATILGYYSHQTKRTLTNCAKIIDSTLRIDPEMRITALYIQDKYKSYKRKGAPKIAYNI